MKNDALAHERNLARDSGEQAVEDTRHWMALAEALRRAGAEVVVGRQHESQRSDKILTVNGLVVDHLVRLRNRPSRAKLGDRPQQWRYRFLVGLGQGGGPIDSFLLTEAGFDYDWIAERLLWVVDDEARRRTERQELRALKRDASDSA